MQSKTQRSKPEFAKRHPGGTSWENFGEYAETERIVIVAEFRVWIAKTRLEVERSLLSKQQHARTCEPFARVAIEKAETPADVPLVVLEYALTALDVADYRRKLDLINVYFGQAATCSDETSLQAEKGNEAEINSLWQWFIEEREETTSTRTA